MDYGAVELSFVHVGNGGFGVGGGVEEDVSCAAVGHDFGWMLASRVCLGVSGEESLH